MNTQILMWFGHGTIDAQIWTENPHSSSSQPIIDTVVPTVPFSDEFLPTHPSVT